MKKLIALLPVLVFAIAAEPLHSQTITFNSVQSPKFCGGDPVVAKFTVTGQFSAKNPFTLQLSNASGKFENGFKNLASIMDSLPGSYTIAATMPTDVSSSGTYRFRIMAALPYTVSNDNGSDISVGELPWIGGIRLDPSHVAVVVNKPVRLMLDGDSLSETATYEWDLGDDAVPSSAVGTSVNSVFFKTGGEKLVTVTALSQQGCGDMAFKTITVLDCFPKIPQDAIVISENNSTFSGSGGATFWVNPGVTFKSGGGCTIFAEPGSTVSVAGSCVVYLKAGASLVTMGGGCTIIADNGASAPTSFTLNCGGLTFDYSDAPPNNGIPLSVPDETTQEISIFPNPSNGVVTITGIPANANEIAILNILGSAVAQYSNTGSGSLQVDLGTATPGTYYVRIVTASGVITRALNIQ